jgi:hypothetical protein
VINLSTFLEFLDQISMMTYCFIVVRWNEYEIKLNSNEYEI